MLPVPSSMSDGWAAPYKGGEFKPTTRVCIQKMNVTLLNYDLISMHSKDLQGSGKFASMPFGQANVPVEMKNLTNVSISRNLNQFCAEATISLTNTKDLAVGVLGDEGEFDLPGYYTYQRGDSADGNARWSHSKNSKNGLVVPDRLIHIYQGYGTDGDPAPEKDEKLVKTFTGLIEEVTVNADKSMSIKCKDLAGALLTQIYYPDVVPGPHWKKDFTTRYAAPDKSNPYVVSSTSGSWKHPKYQTDSNVPYIGHGFTDGSRPYVQSNGGVNGHLGKHAFDSSSGSYYLSVGNYERWESAYEYVQGTFSLGNVTKVKIKAYGGPYTVYISLKDEDGGWMGKAKIPYKYRAVDTNADIKFVKRIKLDKGETKTIRLPKAYAAKAIRVTFADLWDSNIGNYQYRAGIADVQVFKSSTVEDVLYPDAYFGNIEDYTGILAWLLAWGGFFWPRDSSGFSYVKHSDGDKINYTHSPVDYLYPENPDTGYTNHVLPHGRIWGDLQMTGTSPIVPLPFSDFDKQPLADCINKIKETIGFNFFIDEAGGAIWRLPNIYSLGNYVSGATGGPHSGYTSDYLTIDENTTLLQLSTTISSKNVREQTTVSNTTGKFGATVEGYNPHPSGLRRYGIWTDKHFSNLDDVRTMADLVALRQFMTYRQSSITIAANPAIQIDDQVRIFEKVTSDTYFHYVTGVQSDWDAATGKWTMALTTQWLGEDPDGIIGEFGGSSWVVNEDKMSDKTVAYLRGLIP